MKTYGLNLSLIFILTVFSTVALASSQSSSAQISELGSMPTTQTTTTNQSEGIIFQGNSLTVFSLGNPYNQDRWQAIDNYTAGGYNIEGIIQYKETEDNNTLRSDRTFVILERQQ